MPDASSRPVYSDWLECTSGLKTEFGISWQEISRALKSVETVPASDDQKAKARKVALLASRTNFALSIPLVLCMGSGTHGLPF